jgi:ribonuclease T
VNALPKEFFISVDVETAGPAPSQYSLLSIGACTVAKPHETFYIELKPVSMDFRPEAIACSNLSLEELAVRGTEPAEALRQFADWVEKVTPEGSKPIFVGFNAAFDWMFIDDYFHRYLKRNPFGHAALDIKSYYMGLTQGFWRETTMRYVGARYINQQSLVHHAMQDAIDQAEIFQRMLSEAKDNPQK